MPTWCLACQTSEPVFLVAVWVQNLGAQTPARCRGVGHSATAEHKDPLWVAGAGNWGPLPLTQTGWLFSGKVPHGHKPLSGAACLLVLFPATLVQLLFQMMPAHNQQAACTQPACSRHTSRLQRHSCNWRISWLNEQLATESSLGYACTQVLGYPPWCQGQAHSSMAQWGPWPAPPHSLHLPNTGPGPLS